MILALGVSGYEGHEGVGYMASMFHLFTHAFFKALLFLGAGAIIHAVHSNVMQDMGGLRKYMPITHITFLIACLTIAGVPFLSAFFSKDEILVAAFHHNKLLFAVEYLVAGITAFYMFRLYFSIFWGKDTHYHHTPHEAPKVMTIPLMILAFGSIVAGYVPFAKLVTADGRPFESHIDFAIAIPSVLKESPLHWEDFTKRFITSSILMRYISSLPRRSFSTTYHVLLHGSTVILWTAP
jgi:NADH-quinone oxidoreductase subunit L